MKRYIKTAAIAILISQSLSAEVIFDIGDQQLSESVNQTYKDATYETDNVLINTGLAYIDGAYSPKLLKSGHYGVKIKEPKDNWSVTFAMKCYTVNSGCGVTLNGANGKAISMEFDIDQINVDGNSTKDSSLSSSSTSNCETYINASVEKVQNGVEVVINGKHKYIINKKDFKLGQIDISINSDGNGATDELTSLSISTSN